MFGSGLAVSSEVSMSLRMSFMRRSPSRFGTYVAGELRSELLGLRVVDVVLQVDGDHDLREDAVAERLDRLADEQKRAEQYDRDRDRSDRGELHAGVTGEVRENLTQEEPQSAPVHGNSSLARRRVGCVRAPGGRRAGASGRRRPGCGSRPPRSCP